MWYSLHNSHTVTNEIREVNDDAVLGMYVRQSSGTYASKAVFGHVRF